MALFNSAETGKQFQRVAYLFQRQRLEVQKKYLSLLEKNHCHGV